MGTEQIPMGTSSSQGASTNAPGASQSVENRDLANGLKGKPAQLPVHSRAAAAQRLNDVPEQPDRGVYYPVPHQLSNPPGWRTKRYIKRRNLRQNNQRYAATERIGTQWTMLPMAFGSLIVIVVLTSVLVTLTALIGATQQRYGQQVTTLEDILPKDSLKAYDAHGTLFFQMVDQGLQTTVPLSQISLHLAHAEIAIEDQNFWNNPGYDITGIVRAALDNETQGHVVSGGSTITQQLIKNAIVGNQATIARKLQEIILAPAVTRQYTKEQILSMYLNTIYYGEQSYGADAAAYTYFGLKDTPTTSAASQLDIAQSAMLAGIPSSPIARDPFLHPQASLERTEEVLQQMYLQGYITHEEQLKAIYEVQQPNFLHHSFIDNSAAPHFTRYVINELTNELHVKPENLSRAGLIVSTTLDLKLQNQVLKIAQTHIAALAKSHNMSDAAVVVIDHHTGAILTLLGNIDPNNPQYGAFDVASQGFRQPGSAFKPFIYATAFAQGVSPGTPVLDGPLTVQMCCGLPSYSPHNYDERFHGLISYRQALQNSFNIPAVKLLMQTGVDQSLHTAQIMGIGDNYEGVPNYTMVLGSLSVHLLDMTSAYGVFAEGGIRVPAHAVNAVTDVQGHVIFSLQPKGTRVISPQQAFMITDVLSDNAARTYEFGKCSALYLYTYTQNECYAGKPGNVRPSAVKTGTSTDFRDNWTIGYTTDLVVGVWAGNNNNTPMVDVTGVDGAGPIWHDTMLLAEQGHPVTDFTNPGGVVKKTVHYPGITTTDWYMKK
ncbi:MAG TPA: transglycosylase domain-containing protein [Ktedonobacteraceae bacterium]|nr:transglycosylase domain-containing protein [Ktedonobacteraceae bacterium]